MKYIIEKIRRDYGIEAHEKVSSVIRVVRRKVIDRNLFGRREFLENVLIDLVSYMIKTDFIYSGGSYVICGMQSAIDACRYCNAQKRRGNYETISIELVDNFTDIASKPDYTQRIDDLYRVIKERWNEDLAKDILPFLTGEKPKLSAKVLAKCRTPEFKAWLKDYIKTQ